MNWRYTKLKHLCQDAGQYGINVSAEQYSQSGHRLIRTSDIGDSGNLRNHGVCIDAALEARHRLYPGDLLLSRSGTIGRSLLVPASIREATYAGYLVRFRPRTDVDPRFLSYIAQSEHFQDQVKSNAISSTIQNFNAERYANISVNAPDLEEQRRIADFLDAEVERIEGILAARHRQLGLLEDRLKTAIAVEFRKQPSSAPIKLKHLLRNRPRYGVLVPEFADSGIPFVRINDLSELSSRIPGLPTISASLSKQYARTVVNPGDLLLSVVGTMGRAAVAPADLAGANIARAVASLRTLDSVNPHLLRVWIKTADFTRMAVEATGTDTAQPTLGMEDLSNFTVNWPSESAAQDLLLHRCEYLQATSTTLSHSIHRQIRVLTEHRQALITAAVTGQLDVRTARSGVR